MKKPFTLVEVLIAMSVLAVFLLGLMQFFSSTEKMRSSGMERTDLFERARIAMDMMANDLTCVYYSQTDKKLKTFDSQSNALSVATIRPEKVDENAKTNVVCVHYEWNPNKYCLEYAYADAGDTFDLPKSFGNKSELIDGVTKFEVNALYGEKCKTLPGIVEIRMELIDGQAVKRIEANKGNTAVQDNIRENATRYEFRRVVSIDRGQPKPKLKKQPTE